MNHLYLIYTSHAALDPVYVIGPAGKEPQVRAAARLLPSAMVTYLQSQGLQVVDSTVIVDDPHKPFWEGAYVSFPQDAGHEYAGKTLMVSEAADGLPMIVDTDQGEMLSSDDMPLKYRETNSAEAVQSGQLWIVPPSFEQVPLGALLIPHGQFPEEQAKEFAQVLREAGYVLAQDQSPAEQYRPAQGVAQALAYPAGEGSQAT